MTPNTPSVQVTIEKTSDAGRPLRLLAAHFLGALLVAALLQRMNVRFLDELNQTTPTRFYEHRKIMLEHQSFGLFYAVFFLVVGAYVALVELAALLLARLPRRRRSASASADGGAGAGV